MDWKYLAVIDKMSRNWINRLYKGQTQTQWIWWMGYLFKAREKTNVRMRMGKESNHDRHSEHCTELSRRELVMSGGYINSMF